MDIGNLKFMKSSLDQSNYTLPYLEDLLLVILPNNEKGAANS